MSVGGDDILNSAAGPRASDGDRMRNVLFSEERRMCVNECNDGGSSLSSATLECLSFYVCPLCCPVLPTALCKYLCKPVP